MIECGLVIKSVIPQRLDECFAGIGNPRLDCLERFGQRFLLRLGRGVRGAGLLVRRLTNPRIRATSSTADILILCVLLIQCILGLTTIPFSAQHPDGSEMLKLVGWAQSVVTFQGGASAHLDGVAWIFRVHLVLGMTIFLLFPFTRLVHVWSAPFEYFTRRYQIVRSRLIFSAAR